MSFNDGRATYVSASIPIKRHIWSLLSSFYSLFLSCPPAALWMVVFSVASFALLLLLSWHLVQTWGLLARPPVTSVILSYPAASRGGVFPVPSDTLSAAHFLPSSSSFSSLALSFFHLAVCCKVTCQTLPEKRVDVASSQAHLKKRFSGWSRASVLTAVLERLRDPYFAFHIFWGSKNGGNSSCHWSISRSAWGPFQLLTASTAHAHTHSCPFNPHPLSVFCKDSLSTKACLQRVFVCVRARVREIDLEGL